VGGLSLLAETLVVAATKRVWQALDEENAACGEAHLAILALGKLGGEELNYSSDIDLLCVFDDAACPLPHGEAETLFTRAVNRLSDALSIHTEEGYVYRVDFRLRPHGGSGKLVPSLSSVVQYYKKTADPWEIQAILKLRPIAGSLEVGRRLMTALMPVVLKRRPETTVVGSIKRMRTMALQKMGSHADEDVKVGIGGIRDIEFLVQGLQLIHLHRFNDLFTGNTVEALGQLRRLDLLSRESARILSKDYLFLRRVEHYLQILEDRQTHLLPKKSGELKALAKRLFGPTADEAQLKEKLATARQRTQKAFDEFVQTHTKDATP
jgi:glutamate-ammonia-ligase adenylyltransferase